MWCSYLTAIVSSPTMTNGGEADAWPSSDALFRFSIAVEGFVVLKQNKLSSLFFYLIIIQSLDSSFCFIHSYYFFISLSPRTPRPF